MVVDWPVTIHPKWQRARPLLVATVWPFYAVRHLARLTVPVGKPTPKWLQLLLLPFALVFLGLPTRLYEALGIVTVLDPTEATNEPLPAPSGQ